VRLAAETVDGVTDVTASYKDGIAEVTYDPVKTNPDAIAAVISAKTGYKVEVSN
jgi:copper chaperone CopZ